MSASLRGSITFVLTLFLALFAYGAPASQAESGANASASAQEAKDQNRDSKEARDQDQKSTGGLDANTFSDRIANDILNDIRDGLEGHSQRLMLSAFDRDKMNAYFSFEDQIQAYFERYEGFRVHVHIMQTTMEQNRGIVLAQFEVEASPRSGGPVYRNSGQLRFELEKGKKGWKVVDLRPRGFFS